LPEAEVNYTAKKTVGGKNFIEGLFKGQTHGEINLQRRAFAKKEASRKNFTPSSMSGAKKKKGVGEEVGVTRGGGPHGREPQTIVAGLDEG